MKYRTEDNLNKNKMNMEFHNKYNHSNKFKLIQKDKLINLYKLYRIIKSKKIDMCN